MAKEKLSKAELHQLIDKSCSVKAEILKMTTLAGSGHPGGSMSAADIVVALYCKVMRHDAKNPKLPDRDRFVLSKGHCAPLLYAMLAECGYFPKGELANLRKVGAMLQGHPASGTTPGVEISTGSLGQGLSVANGIALAGKLDRKDYRVYCLLGDGELQEGQIWEAAMTAGHYKLGNVIAIVDYNNLQIDGNVSQIKEVQPIDAKFKAFGWNVIKINGHDFQEIINALEKAKKSKGKGKPTVIIANTVKGKGVSFMENVCDFHGKALTDEELKKALQELKELPEKEKRLV